MGYFWKIKIQKDCAAGQPFFEFLLQIIYVTQNLRKGVNMEILFLCIVLMWGIPFFLLCWYCAFSDRLALCIRYVKDCVSAQDALNNKVVYLKAVEQNCDTEWDYECMLASCPKDCAHYIEAESHALGFLEAELARLNRNWMKAVCRSRLRCLNQDYAHLISRRDSFHQQNAPYL